MTMENNHALVTEIINIIKGNTPLYTDGNNLSTDKNDFPATPCYKAGARDIILLSNQIDSYKNDDGTIAYIELFVEINNEEVCIDVLNNKVIVGFYILVEMSYRTQDDVFGLYDEIINSDYI